MVCQLLLLTCKSTSQHYVGEKWGESESLYWLSKTLLLSDIENPLSPRKDKASLIHEHERFSFLFVCLFVCMYAFIHGWMCIPVGILTECPSIRYHYIGKNGEKARASTGLLSSKKIPSAREKDKATSLHKHENMKVLLLYNVKVCFCQKIWCFCHNFKQTNIFLPWNWKFKFWWLKIA